MMPNQLDQNVSIATVSTKSTDECLSLTDGYYADCELVQLHNKAISASDEEILAVPVELHTEFVKLSSTVQNLSRAFELGLVHE